MSSKKNSCRCRNHRGNKKQSFSTRDAALSVIMRHHAWTGKTYSIYECPTSNKFHVRSDGVFKKTKKER